MTIGEELRRATVGRASDVRISTNSLLTSTRSMRSALRTQHTLTIPHNSDRMIYNLLPRRPPFLLVASDGIGVTSSIRPIFIPERARARSADWAPGPGVFVFVPPVALSLMCNAVMPTVLHFSATSCAANIAAYGDASSRSAFTFIPPVTRTMVSLGWMLDRIRAIQDYGDQEDCDECVELSKARGKLD